MQVEVRIHLPDDLVTRATAILTDRGSTLEDFIRMKLKGLTKSSRHFGLSDRMTFGKYREESVKDIICTDPRYIHWALGEIDGFSLSISALELLANVEAEIGE